MRIPIVKGIIERRILANFRIDPDVLAQVLPRPFRPKTVAGYGIGGICLIRLRAIRPRFLPELVGIASENAAHRFAVEWETDGATHEGVYIPRRDTSSRWNALVGGRLFPGVHHHASFQVSEQDGRYLVAMDSTDRSAHVLVEGRVCDVLPAGSVFPSVAAASRFFEGGSLGYSATAREGEFDGLELAVDDWSVVPLDVSRVESSYFENPRLFPPGSVQFDCALLMCDLQHEWHGRSALCCAAT